MTDWTSLSPELASPQDRSIHPPRRFPQLNLALQCSCKLRHVRSRSSFFSAPVRVAVGVHSSKKAKSNRPATGTSHSHLGCWLLDAQLRGTIPKTDATDTHRFHFQVAIVELSLSVSRYSANAYLRPARLQMRPRDHPNAGFINTGDHRLLLPTTATPIRETGRIETSRSLS